MEKLGPSYTAGGNDSLRVSQVINHQVSLWSSNSTPRHLSKSNENICPHRNVYTCVHSIFNHNSQRGKDQMAVNWWMNFQQCSNPYNIYYLTIKRNNDSCCNVMNLDNIMLSERSQPQRATCCRIPCIWNVQNREICGDWKISDCLGLGW